jgi:hypothetical protein
VDADFGFEKVDVEVEQDVSCYFLFCTTGLSSVEDRREKED